MSITPFPLPAHQTGPCGFPASGFPTGFTSKHTAGGQDGPDFAARIKSDRLLETFLGTTQKAQGAFDILQQFAVTTPSSVREVVKAFNIMIGQGLKPSIRALQAFGNVASGSGKNVLDFVEAVADAATDENARLKEFGIVARTVGNEVTFVFGDTRIKVQKDARAITETLIKLGETKFGEAMERQTQTLAGAFSNFGDAVDKFFATIGDAGFNDALVRVTRQFTAMGPGLENAAKAIGGSLAKAVSKLPAIVDGLGRAFRFATDNVEFFKRALITIAFFKFAGVVISAGKALILYAKAVRPAGLVSAGFNAIQKLTRKSFFGVDRGDRCGCRSLGGMEGRSRFCRGNC